MVIDIHVCRIVMVAQQVAVEFALSLVILIFSAAFGDQLLEVGNDPFFDVFCFHDMWF